jgi:hypothetical protein
VTESRYGAVVFEGVCTDTSNAAYPVEEVRRAVEPRFDPPWDESAIHLGLTLFAGGFVEHTGDGFVLSEDARTARENGELIARVCDKLNPTVTEGKEDEAAEFVVFVDEVVDALAEDV